MPRLSLANKFLKFVIMINICIYDVMIFILWFYFDISNIRLAQLEWISGEYN